MWLAGDGSWAQQAALQSSGSRKEFGLCGSRAADGWAESEPAGRSRGKGWQSKQGKREAAENSHLCEAGMGTCSHMSGTSAVTPCAHAAAGMVCGAGAVIYLFMSVFINTV